MTLNNDLTGELKVSVVTAVRNRADVLSFALSSIACQTHPLIEKVIIDGDSSDNSAEVARSFCSFKDKLLSETDMGIYDALNKGVQLSTGDIICFLHSDDCYYSNTVLADIVSVFKRAPVDIVIGDVAYTREHGTKLVRRYGSIRPSRVSLACGLMPAHPATFVRREVFDRVGLFRTDLKIASDFDFFCRVVSSNVTTINLKDIMVVMQIGGASTGSLQKKLLLNSEVQKVLSDNGIYSNSIILNLKYFQKLYGLFVK